MMPTNNSDMFVALQKSLGWSDEKCAEMLGVTPHTIRNWQTISAPKRGYVAIMQTWAAGALDAGVKNPRPVFDGKAWRYHPDE